MQKKAGTFYLGVNGCQGSGKSTLSDFLGEYFKLAGKSVAIVSLDDFYHTRAKRQQLAEEISPLLATRGVPGTHDTTLMATTLKALREPHNLIALPRFDKSQDNPVQETLWPQVSTPVDVVIMEGWCWGVSAQSQAQLANPVNELESSEDPDGIWRNWVNAQIQQHYESLYRLMDSWVMLKAPSFDNVYNWRLEQEQKLLQKLGNTHNTRIMDESEIYNFIQFYQRLTQQCLEQLPQQCQVVFQLDSRRQITSCTGLNAAATQE